MFICDALGGILVLFLPHSRNMAANPTQKYGDLVISSYTSDDIAHPSGDPHAYEWWYFDALSDDGSEAVVVRFMQNSVYSRRYNSRLNLGRSEAVAEAPSTTPSVFFAYYRDGKPVCIFLNEYSSDAFRAGSESPECVIGECSMRFESAEYGSGFSILINSPLARGRFVEAHLEWLSVESDLLSPPGADEQNVHRWNVVCPRSDVTGRITVFDKDHPDGDAFHFRGTGYHDHISDSRWLPAAISERHWGRAHFSDRTAVFGMFAEVGRPDPVRVLIIVRDGEAKIMPAVMKNEIYVRDKFGIRYPAHFSLTADDGTSLSVNTVRLLESHFYQLRTFSEMSLDTPGSGHRETMAMSEILAPKTLQYRWLDWLTNLRTSRRTQ